MIGLRGVFFFSELAPAHPPLAHSIHASGLAKYFRLREGIGPRTPAPGLCGYPSGLVGLCANAHKQCSSGGFFYVVRPFVGAGDEAGKMPTLHLALGLVGAIIGADRVTLLVSA